MNMHIDPEQLVANRQTEIERLEAQIESLQKQVSEQQAVIAENEQQISEQCEQLEQRNKAFIPVSIEYLVELEEEIDRVEDLFFQAEALFSGCYYMADEEELKRSPSLPKALCNMHLLTKGRFELLEEPVNKAQTMIRSLNLPALSSLEL